MKPARHVLRYLKGTKDQFIVYNNVQNSVDGIDGLSIIGYADADHGGDQDDRKSTTTYTFLLTNGAIFWPSHKQASIAVSTMESECMTIRMHLGKQLQDYNSIRIPIFLHPLRPSS
jgi:hypothetical protein